MIRTLIVDDEPLARDGIRVRLEQEADIEIAGEAGDGLAAAEAIKLLLPDLVFLDVQMPGCNGFQVVEKVADVHLPVIVFVTAYDQYALKAFDVHALDYLLKPFTGSRFQEALHRARAEINREGDLESHRRLLNLLASFRATTPLPTEASTSTAVGPAGGPGEYIGRLSVKDGERYILLRAEEIDWVESAANYVRLFARGANYLIRMTMTELERRLDPKHFARIHRSTIVNINRVKEIRPEWHGDFDVVLGSGKVLRMSRKYRSRLLP